MNKQTEALKMAKQHIIERKGGRGGAVCYVKSDEDVIKAIDEALEQEERTQRTMHCGTADAFIAIDDEHKRRWFVQSLRESQRRKELEDMLEQPAQEYLTRAQQVIRANNSAQEPVAWMHRHEGEITEFNDFQSCDKCEPLYTHPAPSFIGLSDDEMMEIWCSDEVESTLDFGRAIEQALKEKNHG